MVQSIECTLFVFSHKLPCIVKKKAISFRAFLIPLVA
jgi:hypothetical protein